MAWRSRRCHGCRRTHTARRPRRRSCPRTAASTRWTTCTSTWTARGSCAPCSVPPTAMTAWRPSSMSPSVWLRRGAVARLVALAAWPADAAAQACCGANGLVIPARLRVYDDYGFGVQATERQTYGSLSAAGNYSGTATGDLVTEQDLFGMARLSSRVQLALLVPYVETYRRIPGQSEWGGFFGDVTVNGRFEVAHAGEHGRWPALTILAGLTAPTGRAPDQAHNPLGTDAAGTGSFQANLGVEVERLFQQWFVTFDGWVSQRP